MWKHQNPSSYQGIKRKATKEAGNHHVSGTHPTDASKEHKSDLTIEKGNPISHREVYFNPPVRSKISRPRSSSASDMEEMSKRPSIISEGPKPSSLYQSSYLPLQPNQPSHPANMFGGTSSLSDQHLTNGGYFFRSYRSLEDSLPRSSMTGYQKLETNITNSYPHHSSTSFINASEILSYKWENSVPFRPSFSLPKMDYSSQTLYDPLVDSINPPDNAGSEEMNISPENSPVAASNNLSGIGENSPDYNQCNYLCKAKSKIASLEEAPNEVICSNDQADSAWPGQPGNVDLAELKMFRVALAEFIKELVKPAWKNGILSIDAHKMIVKRASDKVLGSVEPHQVPNCQESVKQYISINRPKIEKLVEGYLEKYCKSNGPTIPNNEHSCIGSSA